MAFFKKKTVDAPNSAKPGEGLAKSVFLAYAVVLLHVGLLAAVGFMILLFKGFLDYMVWILIGLGLLLGFSAWFFFRRIRRQGKALGETLDSPAFRGRPVEVQLLGGMATVKIGTPDGSAQPPLIDVGPPAPLQLEDPGVQRVRELQNLAQMFKDELISPEEYQRCKDQLFATPASDTIILDGE